MGNISTNSKTSFFANGKAFAWMAAITALCVPILKAGIQLPIILLLISWIFTPKGRGAENAKPILIFIGIYLFHLIAISYTSDKAEGLDELVQKLSLILFPILFGTSQALSARQYRRILSFFCYGVFLAVGFSFVTSALEYKYVTQEIQSYYMKHFSPVHHASYLAMYINLAICILGFRLLNSSVLKHQVLYMMAISFLCLSLIFPASKMGFIVFTFLICYLIFLAWRLNKLKSKRVLFFMTLFIAFVAMLKFDPIASSRVKQSIEVNARRSNKDVNQIESNQARKIAWTMALETIIENPFGVGTGDVSTVLDQKYMENSYDELAEISLNPHNNFLQIAVAQGLLAMIWFIYSLLYPMRKILRNGQWIYAFFLMSIFLNFMVESMLQNQAGVIYFGFFNAVFFFCFPTKKELLESDSETRETH